MRRPIQGTLSRFYSWLTDTLIIQLLLTSAVIPFLLCWKLPYTPLSILGNIIHPLFLLPFLALSSMLFFAVLLGLPTGLLCWLLTKLHYYWTLVLHMPVPALWLRMSWWHLLPAGAVCITIWYAARAHAKAFILRRLISLCMVTIIGVSLAQWLMPPPAITKLVRGGDHITCTLTPNGTLTLHDYGYLSKAANSDAVVDYELMPHIVSTYGTPQQITLRARKEGVRIKKVRKILREWGFVVQSDMISP